MHPRQILALTLAAGAVSLFSLAASESTTSKSFTAQQKRWWAFQPVVQPTVPAVKDSSWIRNEIDAFILAKLEENELRPNPPAGKATLLRRATLDVTGLAPTPEQLRDFLNDTSPQAFEKVVDRLLASPAYGERWARHWLDVARYADSEGFKSDETRPNVWRYRDYVIDSFNHDKPYDRFVQEQIAGDEMFPGSPSALIATGFNRHFPDESNARNLMQRRQELLNDVTDTVGSAFMAMTVGCARCHDHKFDPILHKDYYRLQAFFANTRAEDNLVLASAERKQAWEQKNAVWEEKTAAIRSEMAQILRQKIAALYKESFDKFPEEIQDAVNTAAAGRTPIQWHMYYKAKPQLAPSDGAAAAKLRGAEQQRYSELKRELAQFESIKPEPLPVAQGMIDNSDASPKTHVLAVGVYDAYQEEVQPGFLTVLDPSNASVAPPAGIRSSGRRTALARWLSSPDNPLTARVMVNRIWLHHFGRGISNSPNDFGAMGERPSHRELLDWLSAQFVKDGWSMKKMHRRILLSNAWQQSSAFREDAAAKDSGNKLVWRFNRQRLEGETIRDSMLQVSGLLNAKMGGPGVFPPLPPGVVTRGGWNQHEDIEDTHRRSIYTFVRRNTRYPMFEAFDMPDTHESCGRRTTTVTSTQALELLNNEQVVGWAKALAQRVRNDSGLAPQAQVERAYRFAFSRAPSEQEIAAGLQFLDKQSGIAGSNDAAFLDFCHMLLNSNEFVYLN
ncbi:MAG: DUF1553 domain-containing protein [Acidobacteriia bacterium]|nr:DUF1553 domain-containing protein [Terriglobia bacterium]